MLHLVPVVEALRSATAARKCHTCGCFHDAVIALEGSTLADPLAETLDRLSGVLLIGLGLYLLWMA